MRALDAVRAIFIKLANFITKPRPRPAFVCGECERWERCGLPPSDGCIVMAAQIARDGGRPVKRAGLPQC